MKLIVVTPAGREKYLRLLSHYVLKSSDVHEWHLWDNCRLPEDLAPKDLTHRKRRQQHESPRSLLTILRDKLLSDDLTPEGQRVALGSQQQRSQFNPAGPRPARPTPTAEETER